MLLSFRFRLICQQNDLGMVPIVLYAYCLNLNGTKITQIQKSNKQKVPIQLDKTSTTVRDKNQVLGYTETWQTRIRKYLQRKLLEKLCVREKGYP